MSCLRTSSRVLSSLVLSSLVLSVTAMVAGCGDDGGGGSTLCGFEDRYLPYQAGHQWTYRVTDPLTGETSTKSQVLTLDTDATLGEIIVQTTTKATGSTISALKLEGEAVVRLRQEDRDLLGALERTTIYSPGQRRLDEAVDKTTLGAQWDDIYTATITDAMGVQTSADSRTDHWEVLGLDVECTSPLGTFQCLHVKRTRTVGGVSTKEFFFAAGIGKVKEVNPNQIEELIACE